MEASSLRNPAVDARPAPGPLLRLASDDRLIALTRRGNQGAFEALVQRYQARLLAFCRHMLGSREDAEDVLQESFAAAYNAILADQRTINVRPWLYRIARNRSLNHLRRVTAVGVDSMDVYFADHGHTVIERILQRENFHALIEDIGQLAESQRTALLLREMDAFSYEQIAEIMDTTVPSVKSLLVRARVGLAEAAEARKLSCDEVRLELGEVSEGLVKISPPARRHVRDCTHCASFQKQLKRNDRALALMAPFGLPILFHKLLAAKIGSTSAGGAAAATSTGAAGGASIAAGTTAAGSLGGFGSIAGIGGSAIAAKAVAGLAAAALVTAVAVGHSSAVHPHSDVNATSAAGTRSWPYSAPAVVASAAQPATATNTWVRRTSHAHRRLAGGPVLRHRAQSTRLDSKHTGASVVHATGGVPAAAAIPAASAAHAPLGAPVPSATVSPSDTAVTTTTSAPAPTAASTETPAGSAPTTTTTSQTSSDTGESSVEVIASADSTATASGGTEAPAAG
jgi:RNA polymerase sigma factor (sigma-70 family)